jgi:hypothetical protein
MVADQVLTLGGQAIGVIPKALVLFERNIHQVDCFGVSHNSTIIGYVFGQPPSRKLSAQMALLWANLRLTSLQVKSLTFLLRNR